MFISAVFILAKTWKQPKCPPTDKWTEMVWCIHTHTHTHTHSRILVIKNDTSPFAATLMDLEIIILSEVSQTEIDTFHMILLICVI